MKHQINNLKSKLRVSIQKRFEMVCYIVNVILRIETKKFFLLREKIESIQFMIQI